MDPCPVLVGREQELSALVSLLDAGGGVAIVSGEAGIGKSRLVREFAALAAERGRIVLWGRPEEVAQPGPYALIVDLLESIAERGGGDVKRDARALVGELVRSAGGDDQRPAPTPRAVAAEIRGLVAQLGSPPLIVLEDLHWADEASHSVVLHLARAARDDGHVLVGTVRGEESISEESLTRLVDTLTRDRIAIWVPLVPLEHGETAAMIELLWGRVPTNDELSELERLAEGVPFFIEELAAAGREAMSVLPRSVEQSVASRLRGLGAEAEEVLKSGSLLAGALDAEVLAVACDVPIEGVASDLARASRAGLLVDLDGKLVFRHGLVRESVAVGIVSVEAVQIHSRLARAIEKVHAGELELSSSALAHHYREAGDRQASAQYAVQAGERALALAATGDARSAYKLALDVSQGASATARLGLAEVEFREGNEETAADLFREAADDLKSKGDLVGAAQALGRLAWALLGRVEASQPLAVLDEGLNLISDLGREAEYARLLVQKGSFLCFVFNESRASRPILMDALETARRSREHGVMAEALDGLAHAAALEGSINEAIELGSEAIQEAKRSMRSESIGRTHNNHAVKLAASGRPVLALQVLDEGRKQMLGSYGRAGVDAIDVTRAWVMWLMGLPTEVATLTARGRSAWRRWRGYLWLLEVWAAVERGDLAVARQKSNEAWIELGGDRLLRADTGGSVTLSFESMQVILAQALLQRAEGNPARAADLTSHLLQSADLAMEPLDMAQVLTELARALIDAGESNQASATSERLIELAQRFPYPYIRAQAFQVEGVLARDNKELDRAQSLFEQSIQELATCSNSSDRARSLRLLAETLRLQGESGNSVAIGHLRQAREIASACGAIDEINRCEAVLRSLGIRPRAGRPKRATIENSAPGLSPRELEIASLVAAGDTNGEIGTRLFLSERTVQDHISHALRKLSLSGRAALASWAVRQGMI